jgi:uncharacterized protein (DUF4415 family)
MSRKKAKEVQIDVTEEDEQADAAAGVEAEFRLKPGRHKFTRGGFLKRHPDFKAEQTSARQVKVRISILLDLDVLNYFKARAAQPHAAPYQTQINNELRALMEGGSSRSSSPYSSLVDDDRFISAVAERVQERRVKRG